MAVIKIQRKRPFKQVYPVRGVFMSMIILLNDIVKGAL
jgi:hypothetical protein